MSSFPFWSKPVNEVFASVNSSVNGLSEKTAGETLRRVGPNRIQSREEVTPLGLFLNQFKSPIVLILIFATIISAFLQDWADAVIILLIVMGSDKSLNMGLTITTIIMSILLLITLFFQFRARKYIPGIYWLAVVLISVVGTLITDNLVDNFGVPLKTTTIVFSLALAATFAAWYASEKTLSVHTLNTTGREAFYWSAILFTFALGTASGDLLAEGLQLGYWKSALMFAAFIGVVSIAYYRVKLNAVLAFWIAYILTRPLGASLGDYLSQPLNAGGLNLGTVGTSAIFLITILSIVTYLARTKKDEIPLSLSEDK